MLAFVASLQRGRDRKTERDRAEGRVRKREAAHGERSLTRCTTAYTHGERCLTRCTKEGGCARREMLD